MRRIIRNDVICPNCGSNYVVKIGKVRGKQAYLCKDCRRKFVESARHWYPRWLKEEAVEMYKKGIAIREISEILEVPRHTVLSWIRKYANPETKSSHDQEF